jgi:hypothetical protein
MLRAERIAQLEERVKDFQRAVEGFERMRARMLMQRQNSSDSAMLRLDEMLKLNARTLKSLQNSLELTSRDLLREQSAVSEEKGDAAGWRDGPG